MLPVLYLDDDFVAVHKPSGLLVHRSQIDRGETRFALQMVRDQLRRRVYAVHRLDKGTSGILLFGLNPSATRDISRQFEAGTVEKRYVAIVRGWPAAAGEIDHPLKRSLDDYEKRGNAVAGPPQAALTKYWCRGQTELPYCVDRYPTTRYALLELEPVTGRRHQLRRHLKHIAHPIIGDATYGKGRHNRLFGELFDSSRLLLACIRLSFAHPADGHRIELRCDLADDFGTVCTSLGWSIRVDHERLPGSA